MEEVVLFFLCFVFVFFLYQVFIVSKAKRGKKKKFKKGNTDPIEVRYLVSRYRLDLGKISYNQLLQVVALVSSLDISIVVTIVMIVDSYFLQLLLAVILVVPIILISYHLVYKFYQKKGMIKNV